MSISFSAPSRRIADSTGNSTLPRQKSSSFTIRAQPRRRQADRMFKVSIPAPDKAPRTKKSA